MHAFILSQNWAVLHFEFPQEYTEMKIDFRLSNICPNLVHIENDMLIASSNCKLSISDNKLYISVESSSYEISLLSIIKIVNNDKMFTLYMNEIALDFYSTCNVTLFVSKLLEIVDSDSVSLKYKKLNSLINIIKELRYTKYKEISESSIRNKCISLQQEASLKMTEFNGEPELGDDYSVLKTKYKNQLFSLLYGQ